MLNVYYFKVLNVLNVMENNSVMENNMSVLIVCVKCFILCMGKIFYFIVISNKMYLIYYTIIVFVWLDFVFNDEKYSNLDF